MADTTICKHCHPKAHLLKLGLIFNPVFERYMNKDEKASHILCDCEVLAYLTFRDLGHCFTY
jgi:hypothetical protein